MKKLIFAFILGIISYGVEIDPDTGLKISKGFEEVKNNCTVCHAASMFTSARGSREEWLASIRWMQETQGLWEFDPETENIILTYLETNYPQEVTSRRRPILSKDLLPPK